MDKPVVTATNADLNGVPHTNGFKDEKKADEKEPTASDVASLSKPDHGADSKERDSGSKTEHPVDSKERDPGPDKAWTD